MGMNRRKKKVRRSSARDQGKIRGAIKPRAIGFALLGAAVIAAVIAWSPVGGALTGLTTGGSGSPSHRAAIIDQLGLTAPNAAFADDATAELEQAGYSVDYYSAEQVTVDLYRGLPDHDYDLVLLRTHSTSVVSRGAEEVSSVALFTNEPYDETKYYEDQRAGRLGFASYTDGGELLFGITADFIENSMLGRFDDTLIVMMGCDGLKNERAAEAFIGKGASSFISWDQFVTAPHTDAATERLLEHLLRERLSPADAVRQTMLEVGPDKYYGAVLKAYPPAE